MSGRKILHFGVAILATMSVPSQARPGGVHTLFWHGGHGGGGHGGGGHRGGGGPRGQFGPQGSFYMGFGGGGFYYPYSPILVIGPGGFLPPFPAMMPPFMPMRGPLLPPPLPGMIAPQPGANLRPAKLKRGDPVRAGQLITIGDRLFRAGNLKKAEERYQQSMRAAPDLAAPRIRLAQVALARGNYAEAANRLREAETAEPGWIITAPDIQSIYGEPAEFSRSLSRLESYLQVHPDDRDAWLVLGAQWFLTGRTAKAADVFKRLDDPKRKPDVALAAFLDASNQAGEKPAKPPDPARDPLE
ncbi:MAG: tetratricopeptide repeat protein [Isosphaerales bacterium]